MGNRTSRGVKTRLELNEKRTCTIANKTINIMNEIPSIINALPKANYILEICFKDGLRKEINIKPFIKNGVSAQLLDIELFKTVKVQDGFICWENGYDFCPEFLYNY